MLRRLHPEQPESFAFTPENQAWAEAQITKFPEGRQASAIIPLFWRAQEQEGWLSRPAIEHICDMLGLAHIRGLEVATFYFMFQLHPVGSVANIQICGTTSCMICGAEDLVAVCRDKIAPRPHMRSPDGRFSWEEVECLGACANAPMAQIGKDYYEDLTAERLAEIIDALAAGEVPVPGPQNGRFASEPLDGLTSLKEHEESGHTKFNAAVQLAVDLGDGIKRIDGTEVPLRTPWNRAEPTISRTEEDAAKEAARQVEMTEAEIEEEEHGHPRETEPAQAAEEASGRGSGSTPAAQTGREAGVDDASGGGTAPSGRFGPGGVNRGLEADEETERAAEKAALTRPGQAAAAEVVHGGSEDAARSAEPDAGGGGSRPASLQARDGKPDDLKRIRGIGPKLERALNDAGIYHYDQIAAWSPAEVAWADDNLVGFKGRVSRDDWVGQARSLASGNETQGPKGAK